MSTCRNCGEPIEWIKTSTGKSIPVDPEYINYDDAEAGDMLNTDGGNCYKVDKTKSMPSVRGRLSHFKSCASARTQTNPHVSTAPAHSNGNEFVTRAEFLGLIDGIGQCLEKWKGRA